MKDEREPVPTTRRRRVQIKIWHLGLLVLFAAIMLAILPSLSARDAFAITLSLVQGLLSGVFVLAAFRFEPWLRNKLNPPARGVVLYIAWLTVYVIASAVVFWIAYS
jgi:hypothetical protein